MKKRKTVSAAEIQELPVKRSCQQMGARMIAHHGVVDGLPVRSRVLELRHRDREIGDVPVVAVEVHLEGELLAHCFK